MKKQRKNRKYIFVVGGVMSGVGKGVSASSIGKILQFHGMKVSAVKIDPYVNVDAGTMNPTEHGETFVLADGYETDQDMGNYERFLNIDLTQDSYMTTGSIYRDVILKERSLGYKGKTVSVVPDVPLKIIEQIEKSAEIQDADVSIVEIGGTLGEYQNILFLEAARMMQRKNLDNVKFVLVSYLPVPSSVGEMKTKPTQQAIRTMGESGIAPDFIIGRSITAIDDKRKEKIAASSMLSKDDIISAPNLDSIYDVPDYFVNEGLDIKMLKKLGLRTRKNSKQAQSDQKKWKSFVRASKKQSKNTKIAIVGKYFTTGDYILSDAYLSVIEALKYSGYSNNTNVEIHLLDARDFEGRNRKTHLKNLKKYNGVLVPGGFGTTGTTGKINVIQFVRENKIPFLGICLGLQLASVEFARNICGIKNATTHELNPKGKHLIVDILPEQKEKMKRGDYGGSMRLGSYKAHIKPKTLAHSIYKNSTITERHRHRYELNELYVPTLEEHGMIISAYSDSGDLPEIIELDRKAHPFFVAGQFHPELQARPLDPHPLFSAFVRASTKKK